MLEQKTQATTSFKEIKTPSQDRLNNGFSLISKKRNSDQFLGINQFSSISNPQKEQVYKASTRVENPFTTQSNRYYQNPDNNYHSKVNISIL